MAEISWETINMIAHDRGDNVVNRDSDGHVLGDSLEKLLEVLLKRDGISMRESMKFTGVTQKLIKQGEAKTKKRTMEKRTSTPVTKRHRSMTSAYESDEEINHQNNKSIQDGYGSDEDTHHKQRDVDKVGEEENYDEDCSEYEFERGVDDDGNDSEKEDPANQTNILIPQTPVYQKLASQNRKIVKSPVEKKTNVTQVEEDTDSDSFDPVGDDDITSYHPLGDIIPTTRRIVVKGANKSYYGMYQQLKYNSSF